MTRAQNRVVVNRRGEVFRRVDRYLYGTVKRDQYEAGWLGKTTDGNFDWYPTCKEAVAGLVMEAGHDTYKEGLTNDVGTLL